MMPKYFFLYLGNDVFSSKKLMAILCGKLPLANAWRFNDPFDSKFGLDHSRKSEKPSANEQAAVDEGYFSEEAFDDLHRNSDELKMRDSYNVACFSECHDLLLMWSHYADSHKGICLKLKYDPKRLPPECFFDRVRYSTHYPTIDVLRTEERSEVETFYLTKSVDWLYEKEWRLVAPANMQGGDGFDGQIDLPFSMETIYLGAQYDSLEFLDVVSSVGKELADSAFPPEKTREISKILNDFIATSEGLDGARDDLLKCLDALSKEGSCAVKIADLKKRASWAILHEILMKACEAGMFEVFQCKKPKMNFRLEMEKVI